ncbi:MAG: CocE/NonD family hydrolase [Nocardioides sp.]|uniref:CocE/NonD family hydrolase n=1 Tax=Nocardioides sp. TaxID=35761 RepID=UPI0039E5005C
MASTRMKDTMKFTKIGPAPVPEDAIACQIPMRDGVLLAADRYHPDGAGPRPVVLVRLPYDKNGSYCFLPEIARYLVGHDYAVVVQDVRGKYRSQGATEFGVHEVADGYDTIDWIARQPWCDGDVVMWGDSYFGMTQIAAAASGHPALRAICPRVTGSQLSTVLALSATTSDVDQISRRGYFATHYVDRDRYEWPIDVDARPLADTFEEFFAALGRRSVDYDLDLVAPSTRRPLTVAELVAATPLPALYTIGWYDNCAMWSWHDVDRLLADPGWSQTLHLRMEAIDHDNYRFVDRPIDPSDHLDVSAAARQRLLPRLLEPALAFYDHCLGRSAVPVPKVTFEVCHGRWHTAESWPPPEAETTTLYAAGADAAGTRTRTGRLQPRPAETSPAALAWSSDGVDLVPSLALDPFSLLTQLDDVAPVSERPDVATLDSAPLTEDLTLAGPVRLTGALGSDRASTDLFARLLDLDPDGHATLVTRGQVRFTGLAGETAFRLELLPTAYRIRAGHRLRLHLASTDFPEFTFNTGDGTDCWFAKRAAVTETTLNLGGPDGLRLSLTVLPTVGSGGAMTTGHRATSSPRLGQSSEAKVG